MCFQLSTNCLAVGTILVALYTGHELVGMALFLVYMGIILGSILAFEVALRAFRRHNL